MIKLIYIDGGKILLHVCLHQALYDDETKYPALMGLLDGGMVSKGLSLNADWIWSGCESVVGTEMMMITIGK